MQSTIAIFERLFKQTPPLFPKELKDKMAHALEHLKNDQTLSVKDIEDTMVKFGYELWPWNQAFRESIILTESDLGEHFLVPRLSQKLQEKYHEFKHYGGTLRDLHTGQPAAFFTIDERSELCVALVDMQTDLREYVARDILSLNKKQYLKRVNEFTELLTKMKFALDQMRILAGGEQDHPTLAHEIRARVRHFEHGLCLLAPELEYHAVCESVDFFKGRKHELNRLKGIHVVKTMSFDGV